MSWTPEVHIGEMRPWPESVRVVRGNSGEAMRYDRSERSNDGAERSSDGVAERIKSVYLVMVADDLLEDGAPLCAYLDVPSAEQRASRERYVDEDGVRYYAWVTEVKVVGE